MKPIEISAAFDSGNIEVLSIKDADASLAIRRDAQSDFFQWFHFRVSGCRGRQGNRMSFIPELSGTENPRPKPPNVALA